MAEKEPTHMPRRYYYAAAMGSNDVNILSEKEEVVARVLSKDSGHENAPEDRIALQHVALLTQAPRMREALEMILDREHEPMHPMIADSVRELLSEIELGCNKSIEHQRQMNRCTEDLQKRMQAASRENAAFEQRTPAVDMDDEDPDHSLNW